MQMPDMKPRLEAFVKSLATTIAAAVPDPRSGQGKRYGYVGILCCIIHAIVDRANGIAAIADLAPKYADLYFPKTAKWREPKRGCFDYLLGQMPADLIASVVAAHFPVISASQAGLLHLDGKTLRGTQKTHILHVTNENGILMAQVTIPDKTNEITVASKALAMVEIAGQIITADAMHTQKELANLIGLNKGYYFLPLKENQPTLLREAQLFMDVKPKKVFEETDFGHGRIVTRTTEVIEAPATVRYYFPDAIYVVRITRERTIKKTGSTSQEVVYYISSVPELTPEKAHGIAKAHWTIENRLHCVLDITFGDDASQFRHKKRGNALASFKRLALAVIRTLGFQNIAQGRRILATT